ncbi:MAG: hydrogenase 3 maturation endopeptidase HyCI [Candidatus Alkanophagales archaeon]
MERRHMAARRRPMMGGSSELESTLIARLKGARSVVVFGVGNELRGDDAAGRLVAERLEGFECGIAVRSFAVGVAPENFTGVLRGLKPSHVVIVDAADFGGRAGDVRVIGEDEIMEGAPSTHTVSLGVLAKYIRMRYGCEVVVIGIQPKTLSGTGVSPEVRAGVEALVTSLKKVFSSIAAKGDGDGRRNRRALG